MRPQKVRIGELLVRDGVINSDQLLRALEEQRNTGRRLGRIFIEGGLVAEEALSQALARQLNIPYINLRQASLDRSLAARIPETLARKFRVIVLADLGTELQLGMVDPTDLFAYDELSRQLKRELALATVTESQLLDALDRLYKRVDEPASQAINYPGAAPTAQHPPAHPRADKPTPPIDQRDLLSVLTGVPAAIDEAPIVRLLATWVDEAIKLRATELHLEPGKAGLQVRLRIDGLLRLHTSADLDLAAQLTQRLKLMCGLDAAERRLPQSGHCELKLKPGGAGQALAQPVALHVATLPLQDAEAVVLRIHPPEAAVRPFDQLGMPESMRAALAPILSDGGGLVLVAGPQGHGRRSTLTAMLGALDATTMKVIAIEDSAHHGAALPAGVLQTTLNTKLGFGWSAAIDAALQHDPDVLMIGSLEHGDSATQAMQAAASGRLVLASCHAADCSHALAQLLDMGVPRHLITAGLRMIIGQRLLRLNCPGCALSVTPTPQQIAWVQDRLIREALPLAQVPAMAAASTIRQRLALGCDACQHTGHLGRVAIFEGLPIDNGLLDAIRHDSPQALAERARRQMQMPDDGLPALGLAQQTLRLIDEGRVTISEAMRALAGLPTV